MSTRPLRIRAHGALYTRAERELAVRAVAIADDTMTETLRAHCVPADMAGVQDCFLPYGADGTRVERVDQAEPCVIEAFSWLYDRGLARIVADARGRQIIVLTKGP